MKLTVWTLHAIYDRVLLGYDNGVVEERVLAPLSAVAVPPLCPHVILRSPVIQLSYYCGTGADDHSSCAVAVTRSSAALILLAARVVLRELAIPIGPASLATSFELFACARVSKADSSKANHRVLLFYLGPHTNAAVAAPAATNATDYGALCGAPQLLTVNLISKKEGKMTVLDMQASTRQPGFALAYAVSREGSEGGNGAFDAVTVAYWNVPDDNTNRRAQCVVEFFVDSDAVSAQQRRFLALCLIPSSQIDAVVFAVLFSNRLRLFHVNKKSKSVTNGISVEPPHPDLRFTSLGCFMWSSTRFFAYLSSNRPVVLCRSGTDNSCHSNTWRVCFSELSYGLPVGGHVNLNARCVASADDSRVAPHIRNPRTLQFSGTGKTIQLTRDGTLQLVGFRDAHSGRSGAGIPSTVGVGACSCEGATPVELKERTFVVVCRTFMVGDQSVAIVLVRLCRHRETSGDASHMQSLQAIHRVVIGSTMWPTAVRHCTAVYDSASRQIDCLAVLLVPSRALGSDRALDGSPLLEKRLLVTSFLLSPAYDAIKPLGSSFLDGLTCAVHSSSTGCTSQLSAAGIVADVHLGDIPTLILWSRIGGPSSAWLRDAQCRGHGLPPTATEVVGVLASVVLILHRDVGVVEVVARKSGRSLLRYTVPHRAGVSDTVASNVCVQVHSQSDATVALAVRRVVDFSDFRVHVFRLSSDAAKESWSVSDSRDVWAAAPVSNVPHSRAHARVSRSDARATLPTAQLIPATCSESTPTRCMLLYAHDSPSGLWFIGDSPFATRVPLPTLSPSHWSYASLLACSDNCVLFWTSCVMPPDTEVPTLTVASLTGGCLCWCPLPPTLLEAQTLLQALHVHCSPTPIVAPTPLYRAAEVPSVIAALRAVSLVALQPFTVEIMSCFGVGLSQLLNLCQARQSSHSGGPQFWIQGDLAATMWPHAAAHNDPNPSHSLLVQLLACASWPGHSDTVLQDLDNFLTTLWWWQDLTSDSPATFSSQTASLTSSAALLWLCTVDHRFWPPFLHDPLRHFADQCLVEVEDYHAVDWEGQMSRLLVAAFRQKHRATVDMMAKVAPGSMELHFLNRTEWNIRSLYFPARVATRSDSGDALRGERVTRFTQTLVPSTPEQRKALYDTGTLSPSVAMAVAECTRHLRWSDVGDEWASGATPDNARPTETTAQQAQLREAFLRSYRGDQPSHRRAGSASSASSSDDVGEVDSKQQQSHAAAIGKGGAALDLRGAIRIRKDVTTAILPSTTGGRVGVAVSKSFEPLFESLDVQSQREHGPKPTPEAFVAATVTERDVATWFRQRDFKRIVALMSTPSASALRLHAATLQYFDVSRQLLCLRVSAAATPQEEELRCATLIHCTALAPADLIVVADVLLQWSVAHRFWEAAAFLVSWIRLLVDRCLVDDSTFLLSQELEAICAEVDGRATEDAGENSTTPEEQRFVGLLLNGP